MEVEDAMASCGSDLMREMELEKSKDLKGLPKDASYETKWAGMVGSGLSLIKSIKGMDMAP